MSNSTVDAALAREIAAITPIDTPATEPLGYGIDVDCVTDCTDDFATLDSESPRAIVQWLLRVYQTPRGMLDDPDLGCDVRGYCNRGVTVDDLRTLQTRMASEARKDDRIENARVTVTASLASKQLDCLVEIAPANPALTDFSLTFSVTEAGVLLDTLKITGA